MKEKELSFESALKRLEEIVTSLEKGDVSLEDAINLFEEGIQTAEVCKKKLESAEKRIKELIKNSDGTFSLSDFHFEVK
ncbi:exodeoxyribonuclease VII small subunit [candidate division WOR-3 bacterium]|nr:exodeoxyribonuclease VII small subunit [candidate division WOR-3 bacterium]TET76438.1 MAG: exodeoxyribonuclease VII small subunit [Candidatus Cloacimonadota bacterium]